MRQRVRGIGAGLLAVVAPVLAVAVLAAPARADSGALQPARICPTLTGYDHPGGATPLPVRPCTPTPVLPPRCTPWAPVTDGAAAVRIGWCDPCSPMLQTDDPLALSWAGPVDCTPLCPGEGTDPTASDPTASDPTASDPVTPDLVLCRLPVEVDAPAPLPTATGGAADAS